jgi:hypothetical protein
MRLLAQAEFFNQGTVAVSVFALQIRQQAFTTIDHHDQTTAGVVILRVGFEVTIQIVDTSCQQCDLYFWGASIVLAASIVRDDCGFARFFDRHDYYLSHAMNRVRTLKHREQQLKTGRNDQTKQYIGIYLRIQTLNRFIE